jgi:hypothetical protein
MSGGNDRIQEGNCSERVWRLTVDGNGGEEGLDLLRPIGARVGVVEVREDRFSGPHLKCQSYERE